MLRRRVLIGLAVAATASAVAVPLTSAASEQSKTSTITVGDDYFAPTDVTVKKGSKVKWVWSDENTDTHNVVLTSKHPKGVKASDFRSSSGAIGITFKRKFDKTGKYGFVCTYHKSVMKVDLTVKK